MVESNFNDSIVKEQINKAILGSKTDRKSIKAMIERVVNYNAEFECVLCLTLVYDPRNCSKCEASVFCLSCIEQLKTSECPSCRSSPFNYQVLNKLVFKCIGNMKVSCPSCVDNTPNSFTYDDLLRHFHTSCPSVQVTCPTNNCLAIIPRSDLQMHLLNDCNNFEVECPTCSSILKIKSEVAAHSCILALKNNLE